MIAIFVIEIITKIFVFCIIADSIIVDNVCIIQEL
jgi:hypothetical protein